jgi:hypothetical protein
MHQWLRYVSTAQPDWPTPRKRPGMRPPFKGHPSLPFVLRCRHHCPSVRPRHPPLCFLLLAIITGLNLALLVLIQQVQEQPGSS